MLVVLERYRKVLVLEGYTRGLGGCRRVGEQGHYMKGREGCMTVLGQVQEGCMTVLGLELGPVGCMLELEDCRQG